MGLTCEDILGMRGSERGSHHMRVYRASLEWPATPAKHRRRNLRYLHARPSGERSYTTIAYCGSIMPKWTLLETEGVRGLLLKIETRPLQGTGWRTRKFY